MKKIRVGIIFGGKSAEHEVSLQSAKNIIIALDKNKYEPVLIGIDKTGKWYLQDRAHFLINENNPKLIGLAKSNKELIIPPAPNNSLPIDVVFPALHGTYGEDGTIQGFLKLANVPFVGAGVLGSALGMDKDVQKRLLRDAGISIAKFTTDRTRPFDFPVFVKPANLGSSVGISKAHNQAELEEGIKEAFKYDRKILIEEAIIGREIEISVLGNEKPITSVPGEILPNHEFYDYEAKYIDENGAVLQIPAKLSKTEVKKIQDLAIKAYKVLCCEGMARVDMFLKPNGEVLINEINTIPGFTKISMYPKLWEVSGISYSELVDRLIMLALDRFKKEKKLTTEF